MSDGFDVQPPVLDDVAATLRTGSVVIETMPDAPPAPEAGDSTAAIAAALSVLTESLANLSESFTGTATSVTEANALYRVDDREVANTFWNGL